MSSPSRFHIRASHAWWQHENPPPPKRTLRATPGFVEALRGASLAIASRQDSALLLLCVEGDEVCATQLRVPAPMGIATDGTAFAIGTAMAIRIFQDISPNDPSQATYLPVSMHVTGAASVHEVGWDARGDLWFVNTQFSALCRTDVRSHFRVEWVPDFVSEPSLGDCCHLNGMAMGPDGPRFATALAATGTQEGWRAVAPDGGVLLCMRRGVILDNLSMPHSPMLYDDRLWLLESGHGRLLQADPDTVRTRTVVQMPGLLRGLDIRGTHAFMGMSRLRPSSGTVADVLATRLAAQDACRLHVVDVRSGEILGEVELPGLAEIASIRVLHKPAVRILQPDNMQTATTFVYAEATPH
ncbi:DUF4915 domain-containing protein [Lysobacter tyrosinilyticus]